MKGIFLDNSRFFYSSETNTIINSEFKDIYQNFVPKRKVKIEDIEISETIIQSKVKNLNQITFEVTQECNLECKYCAYSSQRYFYQRTPSSQSLNFETARKVLNYIKKIIHSRSNRELVIGFYGGEPLLKYQLIKQIVADAKHIFKDWELLFTMTTNGTLLTEEIIRFLRDNSFYLHVSLDGPEENHDAKRVFSNGQGSFQKVMENLNKIKEIDKEYFKKTFLNPTISKDLSFDKTVDFFRNNELVKHLPQRYSYVSEKDSDYYRYFPYDKQTFRQSVRNFYKSVLEKKRKKMALLPIESNRIDQREKMDSCLKNRHFLTTAETCFFDNRLFIDAYGQFHVCEKVNQSNPIGNAESGYDFSRMKQMLNEFSEVIKSHCMECEVNCFCERCFATFARDGRFEMDHEYCKNTKRIMENTLNEFIQLKREGII